MSSLRDSIIFELGVKPEINPEQEVTQRVDFLYNYLRTSGANGYVLGISGGQDSTLAGKLAAMACEKAGLSLLGVMLPYGEQKDIEDANHAIDWIGCSYMTHNIAPMVDSVVASFPVGIVTDFNKGNIKARMRMIVQYALAGQFNFLVVGTDHAAENVTGFFTKFGDGAADIMPLYGLNKRQGRQLLQHLGCPERLYLKKPTADLLDCKPGQPDEVELGLTYDQIDDYLEDKWVDDAVSERIEAIWLKTMHKRRLPVTLID